MKVKGKGPEATNGDSGNGGGDSGNGGGDAKKVKKSPAKKKNNKKSPNTSKMKKKAKEEKSAFEEAAVPLTRFEEESGDSDREEDVGVEDGKGGKKKVRYYFPKYTQYRL